MGFLSIFRRHQLKKDATTTTTTKGDSTRKQTNEKTSGHVVLLPASDTWPISNKSSNGVHNNTTITTTTIINNSNDDDGEEVGSFSSTSSTAAAQQLPEKMGRVCLGFCDMRIATILFNTLHLIYATAALIVAMLGLDIPGTTEACLLPFVAIVTSTLGVYASWNFQYGVSLTATILCTGVWIVYWAQLQYVGIVLGTALVCSQAFLSYELRMGIMTHETYQEEGREEYLVEPGRIVLEKAHEVYQTELVPAATVVAATSTSILCGSGGDCDDVPDDTHGGVAESVHSGLTESIVRGIPFVPTSSGWSESVHGMVRTVSRMMTEQSEPYLAPNRHVGHDDVTPKGKERVGSFIAAPWDENQHSRLRHDSDHDSYVRC